MVPSKSIYYFSDGRYNALRVGGYIVFGYVRERHCDMQAVVLKHFFVCGASPLVKGS